MARNTWSEVAIPGLEAIYEITRGDQTVVLNDRTIEDSYIVDSIDGIHDTPGIRESRQPRPGSHGSTRGGRALEDLVWAFNGYTRAGNFRKLRAMQAALKNLARVDPVGAVEEEVSLKVRPVDSYVLKNYGSKVFVNWLANPNFEIFDKTGALQSQGIAPDHWSWRVGSAITQPFVTRDAAPSLLSIFGRPFIYGSQMLRTSVVPSGTGPTQIADLMSEMIPIREGVTDYAVSLVVNLEYSGTPQQRLSVRWYDAGMNEISTVQVGSDNTSKAISKQRGTVTAPVGARWAQIIITFRGAGNMVAYISNAMFTEGFGPRHFIGPGMPGCVFREMPAELKAQRYPSGYWIGHRPHNLMTIPAFGADRFPELGVNTSLPIAVGDRAPFGYADPGITSSSKLDVLERTSLERSPTRGIPVRAVAAGTVGIGDQPVPVMEGNLYAFSAYFEPSTIVRDTQIQVIWLSSAGVAITTVTSLSVPEHMGERVWNYFEAAAPIGAAQAEVTFRVLNAAINETHVISGKRMTVGDHEEYASGDYPGWNYLGETPVSWQDFFDTNTIAQYADLSGTMTATVTGSSLTPSSTADKKIYKTGRKYSDVQLTFVHRPGTGGTFVGYFVGGMARINSVDDSYISGHMFSNDGNTIGLVISKRVGVTTTSLKSMTFVHPFAVTDFTWLRFRVEGNLATVEFWDTDPGAPDGGMPIERLTHDLEGTADEARFGAGAFGEVGLLWGMGNTNARVDSFVVDAAQYVDTTPANPGVMGYSEETANDTYLVEKVDLDVKQSEKQDSNMRTRPFLLTVRARDPRVYSTTEREVEVLLRGTPPSYIVLDNPHTVPGETVELAVGAPLLSTTIGETKLASGTGSTTQYAALPAASEFRSTRQVQLDFAFDSAVPDSNRTASAKFYVEIILKRVTSGSALSIRYSTNGVVYFGRYLPGGYAQMMDFTYDPIAATGVLARATAWLEGDVMRSQFWGYNHNPATDPPDGDFSYTLTGTEATTFGEDIAGLSGYGLGANFALSGVLPHGNILRYTEGEAAGAAFSKRAFVVEGNIETPCTITLRGPATNPYVEIPESGIFIYTDMVLDQIQEVTIHPNGRVTGGSFGSEANLLAGTRIGCLSPGKNTLSLGGLNMAGGDPEALLNTRLAVAWRNAGQ